MNYLKRAFREPAVATAILILTISVLLLEWLVMRQTNGVFSYPLDDAYIHMAIARNLAFSGNWGITPYEFGSASSSLLYTVLLASVFKVFGAKVFIPVLLNMIAGIAFLLILNRYFRKSGISQLGRFLLFMLLIVLIPLPTLIISGMEHVLHCIFSFLFIFSFSDWLNEKRKIPAATWEMPWKLIVYAVIALSLRYESVFFVATACFLLLLEKKIWHALVMGAIALLPIILFGLYSLRQGSYFFPNSVLMKAGGDYSFSPGGILFMLQDILQQKLTIPKNVVAGLASQRLLIIIPLLYLIFQRHIVSTAYRTVLLLLAINTVLHLAFSGVGFFFRYEAYLFSNTGIIAGILFYKYGKELWRGSLRPAPVISALVLFALCFPLLNRSASAFSKATVACTNIYEQQYQMAKFLRQNFSGSPIAANDIGAINFFYPANNLDLLGLGNIEVARSKKEKYYSASFLDSLTRQRKVEVAMLYDTWFPPELLERWHKVGSWEISNNVACANSTVFFYVTDSIHAPILKQKLVAYNRNYLPKSVKVAYY